MLFGFSKAFLAFSSSQPLQIDRYLLRSEKWELLKKTLR